MLRSDYLNPADIKSQCIRAIRRMEEDRKTLRMIGGKIDAFTKEEEIAGQAFEALKRQLGDYGIVIEAMQAANDADIADFRSLCSRVGGEVLDGETIFRQMENAQRMIESYLAKEELYRKKMQTAEDVVLYVYYQWKARQYNLLSKNSQRIYEKWEEKSRRFDEIASDTEGLFADSADIGVWIAKGFTELSGAFQNGGYVGKDERNGWRKEIMNIRIRLARGYGDNGGDQNMPYMLWQRGLPSDREYMRELIHSYEEYEKYSDKEIADLLCRLGSEGCGYAAFANIIADEYRRKDEEFEDIFGFPLFSENVNGNTYVNYNHLMIDLYCATDNHKNVKGLRREYDSYDKNEDISATSGRGTTPEDRIYRFEKYMDAHGVKVRLENIECKQDEVYIRCEEELKKGNRLIISTCPVRLEDREGEPAWMDGGHAMTVTALTDDGRIEVSSWGELYYITPEDSDYHTPEKNRAGDAYIRIQSVKFQDGEEQ